MSDTWSNLLKRQTGLDINYPVRPAAWYAARLRHEPLGCLCVEEAGSIVATGFALSNGRVGWIGPMEVAPARQGHGLGTLLLGSLETFLMSKGCKAVGLETMKDVARNMTFYERGGYVQNREMLYLEKGWLEGQDAGRPEGGKADLQEIRRLAGTLSQGFDPSVEFLMYEEMGTGITLHGEGAAALLVMDPIPGSGKAYLRTVLSEGYHRLDEAIALIQRAEREALWRGAKSMFSIIPAQSELLNSMLHGGYRPKGADVRLMKGTFDLKHECAIFSWSG